MTTNRMTGNPIGFAQEMAHPRTRCEQIEHDCTPSVDLSLKIKIMNT